MARGNDALPGRFCRRRGYRRAQTGRYQASGVGRPQRDEGIRSPRAMEQHDVQPCGECLRQGVRRYRRVSAPALHAEPGGAQFARKIAGDMFVPEAATLPLPEEDEEQAALLQRLSTLTPQQVRVLMMLSDGLMNKQITYELSISEATVKAHVSAILQKLDVDSRTQAVIAAARIEKGQFGALLSSDRAPV